MRPHPVRATLGALFSVAILGACGEPDDARPRAPVPIGADAEIRVHVEDGVVTVHARAATLHDVIARVAAASGLTLQCVAALDETVAVDIAAEPLLPALRTLLAGRSFLLQDTAADGCGRGACRGTLWVLAEDAASAPIDVSAPYAAELEDPDASVRADALYALSSLPGAPVDDARANVFRRALVDADREVRAAAVSALENLGDEEALAMLTFALDDAEASIRAMAADAIVEVGGPGHPSLQRALSDESFAVREAAAGNE